MFGLGHGDVGFFDRIAPLYDAVMPPASPADLRAGLAFAHRPVERVVDLGGGTGRVARALGRVGVEATVVDYSRGMLRRAAADGFPVVRGDAARLPVSDGGVDAVVVADALHHFPDPEAALGEAARALAPGGVVVVREFDPGTRRGRALARTESIAGMNSRFLSPESVTATLDDAGLRSHVVDPGFGYTVVGVKPTDAPDATDATDEVAGDADAERGR
ncbi:methyltransferase domain-containing protein [Halobaculum sp. CBA1158]|uniref:class I SAM-dependent methyltransferase n=1 Tax=Halobaculum sp. CBA1158 TaxID=2904243 RepID=UPI001F355605|nr:methyltransferase domain-containing protein [Halobaculum sp. CBA1158]UIO98740.1 methyltransferase domain-containing protein [Halobaculum sp. CBA1158]